MNPNQADHSPNISVEMSNMKKENEGKMLLHDNKDESDELLSSSSSSSFYASSSSAENDEETGTVADLDDEEEYDEEDEELSVRIADVEAQIQEEEEKLRDHPLMQMNPDELRRKSIANLTADDRLHVLRGRRRFSHYSVADEPGISPCMVVATRVIVAFICVSLLWVTTLDLCTRYANYYYPAPSFQQISDAWQMTVDLTVEEEDAHLACALRQVSACDLELNVTADAMIIDNRKVRASNEIIGSDAELIAEQCVQSSIALFDAVATWLSVNTTNHTLIYDNVTCSAAEIEDVKTYVGDFADPSSPKSDAYVVAKTFTKQAQVALDISHESMSNRSTYDINYVASKAEKLMVMQTNLDVVMPAWMVTINNILTFDLMNQLDAFQRCVAGTGCVPVKSIVDAYQEVADGVQGTIQELKETADSVASEYQKFANAVANEINRANDFITSCRGVWNDVKNAIPSSISLPNMIDNAFFPPYVIPPIPAVPSIPDVGDYFAARITDFRNTLNANIHQYVTQPIADALTTAKDNIHSVSLPLVHAFEDYHPPPMQVPVQFLIDASTEFLLQSASALKATTYDIQKLRSRSVYGINVELPNTTVVDTSGSFSLRSVTNFQYAGFGGQVKYTPLVLAMDAFIFLFLIADYVFRGYRSVKEIVKFMGNSAINLPVVDVRQFKNGPTTPASVMFLRCISSPAILYLLLVIVVVLCLFPAANTYMPLYYNYQDGCVTSRNGTVVTHNLFSVMYNYAASDGNKEITWGLERNDKTRVRVCREMTEESSTSQADVEARVVTAQSRQKLSSNRLQLFEKCIKLDESMGISTEAQADFETSTGGLHHPLYYLGSRSATCRKSSVLSAPLQQGQFNCSILPPCSVTCPGPDEPSLAYAAHESGCRTEWLVHSMIFRTFLSGLMYSCINISRVLLCLAICRLCWRALTPQGFSFLGSCSRTGKTTVNVKTQLRTSVKESIETFTRNAKFMILIAVFIHIPYLLFTLLVPNIEIKPA
eukprot:TRINITY_DN5431_c0_g1_i1.p1 TRINITY_DN5431_c0_g1~~TRINITY_DN5431_c0_g1_i1.p1  ORF type:complete len:1000 (-),score=231.97 TRINITY_DN5431_c0_g1_i1:169-3168(-)